MKCIGFHPGEMLRKFPTIPYTPLPLLLITVLGNPRSGCTPFSKPLANHHAKPYSNPTDRPWRWRTPWLPRALQVMDRVWALALMRPLNHITLQHPPLLLL